MYKDDRTKNDDFSERAKEKMSKIVSEVTEKGKTLLNEGLENAREIIEEKTEAMKLKAGEIQEKTVGEITEDVKSYVRRHPFKSLAIAAALGAVLSRLFGSNNRD